VARPRVIFYETLVLIGVTGCCAWMIADASTGREQTVARVVMLLLFGVAILVPVVVGMPEH
jgi:hypothetical protein